MFIDGRDPDGFYIAMGLINGEPDLPLAHHIFVGSKALGMKLMMISDNMMETHIENG